MGCQKGRLKMESAIKAIRKKSGLSQAKFAARYDIPKRTLEAWEAMDRMPPVYLVELLNRAVTEDYKEGEE